MARYHAVIHSWLWHIIIARDNNKDMIGQERTAWESIVWLANHNQQETISLGSHIPKFIPDEFGAKARVFSE